MWNFSSLVPHIYKLYTTKMKIALIVTYLLIFNISQGQILENMNTEQNNNKHLLEVVEPVMKNVLSEKFIGENVGNHNSDIQEECLNRLKKIYTDEEIETLRNNVPENYKIPYERRDEILLNLIEYTRDTFNPELLKVQKIIYSQLSNEEKEQLVELKEQYRNAINFHFEQKNKEVLANTEWNENEMSEKIKKLKLEHELAKISPNLKPVWRINSQDLRILTELTNKYDSAVLNSEINYKKLAKDRFKINIGRLGNFASAMMYFAEKKEKIETALTREVLLIN